MQWFRIIVLSLFINSFSFLSFAVEPWPADSLGTFMSSSLQSVFPGAEGSGLVFHHRLQKFVFASDNGSICIFDLDGSNANCITPVGRDLEGVTIVDENKDYVYLASEYPYQVFEFDIVKRQYTGKSWSIPGISGATNMGIEGITFVPNQMQDFANSTSGGLFYLSHQETGKVLVYDLNLSASGTASKIAEFTPVAGRNDLSDLYFDWDSQTLYGIYDASNRLVEMDANGVVLHDFTAPSSDQEGIALITDCAAGKATVYIAEDSGPNVYAYENYPVVCENYDQDQDGVPATSDCNDNDASVSVPIIYFVDADLDGYGSTTGQSICSFTAPSGYVLLANDCNDADASVYNQVQYYQDTDGDGLGNPLVAALFCSNTAPAGYVNNASDSDDTVAQARIEIADNAKDDDGDGIVDEYNTVAENGYHPYAKTNPGSGSSFRTKVKSFMGISNGNILVRYMDNAVYRYNIFAISTSKLTKVSSPWNVGYLKVTNPLTGRVRYINAYTGK